MELDLENARIMCGHLNELAMYDKEEFVIVTDIDFPNDVLVVLIPTKKRE